MEYAPGPKDARAAAMTVTRTAAGLVSTTFKRSWGSHESANAALTSAARTLPNGVRKPNRKETPLAIVNNATIQVVKLETVPFATADAPWANRMIPAVARNSSRPTPGEPAGNVENNLRNLVPFRSTPDAATHSLKLKGCHPHRNPHVS